MDKLKELLAEALDRASLTPWESDVIVEGGFMLEFLYEGQLIQLSVTPVETV